VTQLRGPGPRSLEQEDQSLRAVLICQNLAPEQNRSRCSPAPIGVKQELWKRAARRVQLRSIVSKKAMCRRCCKRVAGHGRPADAPVALIKVVPGIELLREPNFPWASSPTARTGQWLRPAHTAQTRLDQGHRISL